MSEDQSDDLALWVRDTRDYFEYLAVLGVEDLPVVAGPRGFQAPPPRTGKVTPSAESSPSRPTPFQTPGTSSRVPTPTPTPPPPSLGPTWKRGEVSPPTVAGPTSLDELRRQVGDCRLCPLCTSRHTLAFGAGGASAPVMLVGDIPEGEWDEDGQPWGGAVGQMLQKIVENVLKLSTSEAYLTSVVKCRPLHGRPPTVDEIETCTPFLRSQARLMGGGVVVALGQVAAAALLGTPLSMAELRGRWWTWEGAALRVTYHPREVLADRQLRRAVMDDMVIVRERMDQQ